jgi:thiol-disulfide isomerase/thioredoxin
VSRREHRYRDARAAAKAAGQADSFRWDPSPDLKALAAEIEKERAPLPRGYLLLDYIRLAQLAPDSTMAGRVLAEIPPDSPLWSLAWGGPDNLFYEIGRVAKRPTLWRDYAERVVAAHPDSSVRAAFLYDLLGEAHQSGDKERAGRYYTQLIGDFPGNQYAEWSRKEFAPDRAIMVKKACPDFAFASLEDSTRTYRAAEFKGKYVLLDFWATWCGPCVGELAFLHRAYEKYKDQGLVILSVSLDEKRETVKRFRSGKWPMPWLHAFLPNGSTSKAAAAFEIVGIPRPVLIGPDGGILAVDEALRGENLDGTLARVMTGPTGPPSR